MPTPTNTHSAGNSIYSVFTAVVNEVRDLERIMIKDGWLSQSWVAKHGPRVPTVKDGMVYLHRGWESVIASLHALKTDRTDLGGVRAAAIELAAAATKFAADLGRLQEQNQRALLSSYMDDDERDEFDKSTPAA